MYEKIGGNYDEVVKRLMNPGMVARFVKKFPDDPSMQQLLEGVKEGDIEKSFRGAHTLKSIAGVLSFTKLYEVAVAQTEQLRPRLEQADPALLDAVKAEYKLTLKAVNEYIESLV